MANNAIPTSLTITYEVLEGFTDSNGKFPNTLGNVALVDCHSVAGKLKVQWVIILDNIKTENPALWAVIMGQYPDIYQWFDNFNFCESA